MMLALTFESFKTLLSEASISGLLTAQLLLLIDAHLFSMDEGDTNLILSFTTNTGSVLIMCSIASDCERSRETSVKLSISWLGNSNALVTTCEMLLRVLLMTLEILEVNGTINSDILLIMLWMLL